MTIGDALSKTFGSVRNFKGDIGLEIETETKEAYSVPKFSFWNVHQDNSLRDFGQEYVLKAPLNFSDELPKALQEFDDKLKGIKFIDKSITTSTHVHLNFLNDTFTTLGNFLTSYSLTENLLMRFSGEDRLSNLFCLPICDAEETYYNILRMLDGIKAKNYARMQFEPENTKYAALNLSALVRYGSLEIRSFRGTTDTKLIYLWTSILYSLVNYSRQEGLVPPVIIKTFKEKGMNILDDIFGKHRLHLKIPNEKELIDKNFWYATNIAYAIKDWSAVDKVNLRNPKLKDLEAIAKKNYGVSFEQLTMDQARHVLESAEAIVNAPETTARQRVERVRNPWDEPTFRADITREAAQAAGRTANTTAGWGTTTATGAPAGIPIVDEVHLDLDDENEDEED